MGGLDMNDQAMQAEFAQIPPLMLEQYKSEIGIPDMKPAVVRSRQGAIPRLFGMRLVNLHRAKREQAGVNTAAAPFGPQPGQRAGNRNGTSPGEEVPHFDQALERQTPVSGAGMTNGLLPPSTPNNNSMTAPSSFSMLSMNGGGAAMSTDLFSMDFINSVANTLEDFDTSIFRPDGDITFERDFQRWFNGDDAMDGGLL